MTETLHTDGYMRAKTLNKTLRLPLLGSIDLSYRCNNDCRHCWTVEPNTGSIRDKELSTAEWIEIIDQARAMGTREWALSGGEPMLRDDFVDILDYIKRSSTLYTLNTNGTRITPAIAKALTGNNWIMVALYGATAETHDHITRNPGSFEATLQGMAYLREAGVRFTVQLIPMRDNFHQWQEMKQLAQQQSPDWRCGAAWLYLSAHHCREKNTEIARQRLTPEQVVALDPPNLAYEERCQTLSSTTPEHRSECMFLNCIKEGQSFHIDPYGGFSFCSYVRDPALRYNLRNRHLKKAWDVFLPMLAKQVKGGQEYLENCADCALKKDCRWCGVYGYLEHGRNSAPVSYLCEIAKENKRYKTNWKTHHRRFFKIAGITIQLDSELPIQENTFGPRFDSFRTDTPGADLVHLHHMFYLPRLNSKDLGTLVHDQLPWQIYQNHDSWTYIFSTEFEGRRKWHQVAIFTRDYRQVRIFTNDTHPYMEGNLPSLTLFPSDQIWIGQLLSQRYGFYLHSAGLILDGQGIAFVGHADAGKSTITQMFFGKAEVLCDDRNIIRKQNNEWHIHGTWSHGDIPIVSSSSAPLRAIIFIEKARENKIIELTDPAEIRRRLLPCVIRPHTPVSWWEQLWGMLNTLIRSKPFYIMTFDKSGTSVDLIEQLIKNQAIGESFECSGHNDSFAEFQTLGN